MTVSTILRGGIGNCLFCIATCYAYSLKHNIGYCIPTVIDNPHYEGQKVFFSSYLNHCNDGVVTANVIKEPHFHYAEIPAPTARHTLLDGYWQSYKYFNDYREEILEVLDIPYEFSKDKIFIHYRSGDYKRLAGFHEIISDEYIDKSISYFTALGFKQFIIFSDEIDVAEGKINREKYPRLMFEYSEGRTETEDLSLMASCEGGIMSASSFSWWGAWLGQNENRKIVYPSDWFGESLSHHNLKDLCPDSWVKV